LRISRYVLPLGLSARDSNRRHLVPRKTGLLLSPWKRHADCINRVRLSQRTVHARQRQQAARPAGTRRGFLPTILGAEFRTMADGALRRRLQGLAGDPLRSTTEPAEPDPIPMIRPHAALVAARHALFQAAEEDIETQKALVLLRYPAVLSHVLRNSAACKPQQG